MKERFALNEKESTLIKKKLAEKKSLLEKLELKFIADQITEELYKKHAITLRQEIDQFSKEIETTSFSNSNLENAVSKCLTIAQNPCQSWVTAEYETKQQLQKLVFPEGILYSKQKGVFRTPRVNSLFEAIPLLAVDSSKNKKADSSKNRLQFNKVPKTGWCSLRSHIAISWSYPKPSTLRVRGFVPFAKLSSNSFLKDIHLAIGY